MMSDEHETVLLKEMKVELVKFIASQCGVRIGEKRNKHDEL